MRLRRPDAHERPQEHLRLRQGQDYADVKRKLQKAGISASLRKHVPARNSDFTQNSRDLREQKKWATHTRQQSFPTFP